MPLIDREKRLLFVHIYRTGGTTIRTVLKNAGYNLDYLGDEHDFLRKVVDKVPDYHKFFSFTFVRNPYDWLASIYGWIKHAPGHPYHQEMQAMDFFGFLQWYVAKCEAGEYGRQYDFIYSAKGERLVNATYHTENLESNLRTLLAALGRATPQSGVPRLNARPRIASLQGEISNKAIYFINDYFAPDFENFGYAPAWLEPA